MPRGRKKVEKKEAKVEKKVVVKDLTLNEAEQKAIKVGLTSRNVTDENRAIISEVLKKIG